MTQSQLKPLKFRASHWLTILALVLGGYSAYNLLFNMTSGLYPMIWFAGIFITINILIVLFVMQSTEKIEDQVDTLIKESEIRVSVNSEVSDEELGKQVRAILTDHVKGKTTPWGDH